MRVMPFYAMALDHGMCCPVILKSFTIGLLSILLLSNISVKPALASHPPQWRPAPGAQRTVTIFKLQSNMTPEVE